MSSNIPYTPNKVIVSRVPISESEEEEEKKLALTSIPSLASNNPLTLNMGDNWPIYVGVCVGIVLIAIIITIFGYFYKTKKAEEGMGVLLNKARRVNIDV